MLVIYQEIQCVLFFREYTDEIIDKCGIDLVRFILTQMQLHLIMTVVSQNQPRTGQGIVAENEWRNNDLILNSSVSIGRIYQSGERYISNSPGKERELWQNPIDGYECISG